MRNGEDLLAPQARPYPEQASARSCGAKNLAARSRIRIPRHFALGSELVPVKGRGGVSQVVPPPCAPCKLLLPCPATTNQARRLCSITEDTRGKVAAGVASPGAGAEAGAGAGAGVEAAGVLLECCMAFSTKRCSSSTMPEIATM